VDEPRPVSASESAYFDGLIREAGEFDPFTDRGWGTLARRFAEMAAPRTGMRILDLGCGTGQSRRLYREWAGFYTGVDLSFAALCLARRKFPGDPWLRADALHLPFADESFDAVCFSSVLHHIPGFGAALAEARRLLVPGGRAFAFDPNLLHPAMALFRHPKSPLYSANGVSPNEAPLLPKRLRERFATAGFGDIRQRAQSDIPYREVAPRLLNAALSLYNAGDRLFERVGLGRTFGTFVITVGTRR
jgi:SAM-dependent methyltransferase